MVLIRKLRSQSGFTLIEMMVVVAIIGVLATLGKYGYDNYIESARQSEAKLSLPTIASTQEQFKSEFGSYTNDLNALRFIRKGNNFWYNVGAGNVACPTIISNGTYGSSASSYTLNGNSFTGVSCTYAPENPKTSLNRDACSTTTAAATIDNYGSPSGAPAAGATSFTSAAAGLISGGKRCDIWTIDDQGSLNNALSGK